MKCVDCKHRHFCAEKAQILGQVFDPNYDGEHGFLDFSVLTNADRIRVMSDEELAKWLCGIMDCFADKCPGSEYCNNGNNGMLNWLKQPAE